jgi:hypothetical protein
MASLWEPCAPFGVDKNEMRQLAGTCLIVALFIAACQPALVCDEPNTLVPDPRGAMVPGVRLGPLLVSTGTWHGDQVARVPWSRAEDLPKFLIAPLDRLERPLTVTGVRCEDGRSLRFAAGRPWSLGAKLTREEIERRTNPSTVIDASLPPDIQVADEVTYGGYFIFTASGRWRIEARDGERVVASAIIDVVGPPR